MKKLLITVIMCICFCCHSYGQNIIITETVMEIKASSIKIKKKDLTYEILIFYKKRGRKLSHAQITCIETNDIYIVRSSKKKSDFLEELLLEANDSVCKQTGKRYTL